MNIDLRTSGLGTATSSPTASNPALSNSGMGKDEFLKLLTTQLPAGRAGAVRRMTHARTDPHPQPSSCTCTQCAR